jgi:hypothetical protein
MNRCRKAGCNEHGIMRYSLGYPAGRYCEAHWATSGYRKEGPEGFDPGYAGERLDDDY